jgi:hypothetical protein
VLFPAYCRVGVQELHCRLQERIAILTVLNGFGARRARARAVPGRRWQNRTHGTQAGIVQA